MRISKANLRLIVVLLVSAVVLTAISPTSAVEQSSAKVQALRQTGKQLLDVGYEQYKRGMYEAAEMTLSKAAVYQQYLSVSDASKLTELLSRLDSSTEVEVQEAQQVQEIQPIQQVQLEPIVIEQPATAYPATVEQLLTQARSYSAQGRYPEAQATFLQAQESGLLTAQQLAIVNNELAVVERVLATQGGSVVISEPIIISTPVELQSSVATDNDYIEFVPVDSYDTIVPVAQPVEEIEVQNEFVTPAEQIQTESIQLPVEQVQIPAEQIDVIELPVIQEESAAPYMPTVDMAGAKENYIEVVKQKQRIQQSYTTAVVNEAVEKAKEHAAADEFAKAKDEIARAASVVEKNKLLLGDAEYSQYKTTLDTLIDEVTNRQSEVESIKAEQAKTQAKAAQEKLRSQQNADRQKRINDLMTHSAEYQEQQRYTEALAQLETLLAIEPTHREALRNRKMLEDIINLRRQLETKREMGKEEQDLFYDNQQSMIPHADLMNYPRNWQDISAKRQPNKITGLTPADAAIYKQLETLVNLSALAPDTPLDEAVEIIRTSVEPPLKLVVRWRDLEENAYIERDTVIGMQGLDGIPLGKGLSELLNSVSGGIAEIDYAVDDGVVTVATRESLPGKLVTHVYDITELIGRPADFRSEMETSDDFQAGDIEEDDNQREESALSIMQMIQETIASMSWLINGGEGTISAHGNRIVVSQTPQIHEQIQKLLMEDLRESLGQQVSIEARFLFVTENFLEDVGIDMQINLGQIGRFGEMQFNQGSYNYTQPSVTLVPGSLASSSPSGISLNEGVTFSSNVIDDLGLTFLLRATQAHRDSKMLTAPRVTVLSGESAYMRVSKEVSYVSDYDFEDITASGNNQPTRVIADPETDTVTGGVVLNVTPTISADKKYVILEISASYTKTNLDPFYVSASETGDSYPISLPTLEVSEVQTRVSVPDSGTLLIGGQKLGAEINKEAGTPGLSKVPIIGRLFSNRSKVKDQDILLVLVKPTIILQDESERDYFAPLE